MRSNRGERSSRYRVLRRALRALRHTGRPGDVLSLEDQLIALSGQMLPRHEVVIGLVGAIGTDLGSVSRAFRDSLSTVHYTGIEVRVSKLIADYFDEEKIQKPGSRTAMDELMDLGDALREGLGHGSAAAALVAGDISSSRSEQTGGKERKAVATIVRQLKHPDEVDILRTIYGPRFVLVGAWSPRSEREVHVERRLRDLEPGRSEDWYAGECRRLLLRDEKDSTRSLGQRVRDTYELADAYVALLPSRDLQRDVTRIVRLLFGSPFETPTEEEQAMFFASGASLRSSDAGRQVGVAVIDGEGELLVTGTNEIPKAGGGQYWVGDANDHRDFKVGFDENEKQKYAILTDLLSSLSEDGWLSEKRKDHTPAELAKEATGKAGPLAKNRVGDLLEFARVAHAEMAAISTAARRGVSLRGHTMYTTTYPCHQCARLIIAAGIVRVVYVDPYPKSQVPQMYRNEVSEEATAEPGKIVKFEPFQGIAPRMYRGVFTATGRKRRSADGVYLPWEPSEAAPRLGRDATSLGQISVPEDGLVEAVYKALDEVNLATVLGELVEQETPK